MRHESRHDPAPSSGQRAPAGSRGDAPAEVGPDHVGVWGGRTDGDVEEISCQLGHRPSVITRSIYRHEVKDAERTARGARMEERYGAVLG
jgi:hypothetical protein